MGQFREGIPDLSVIRRSRGVSLEEIARSTRISVFYLRAIENGHLDKLPGGIYTSSYVRQYARAIDYSEEDLLGSYGIPGEEDQVAEQRPVSSSPGRFVRLMSAVLHVGALASGAKRTG